MRYYDGSRIDNQGRVCLNGYVKPLMRYVVYMMEADDIIYLEPYGQQDVLEKNIRKTDSKGRVIIPRCFRGDTTRVLIGRESSGRIVLRLIADR